MTDCRDTLCGCLGAMTDGRDTLCGCLGAMTDGRDTLCGCLGAMTEKVVTRCVDVSGTMAENGRMNKAASILDAFNQIMLAHKGIVLVKVTSAQVRHLAYFIKPIRDNVYMYRIRLI